MNLPSAAAPMVSQTCPWCDTTRMVPVGERIPDCQCKVTKRPSERTTVEVYQLIEGHPSSFKFFAKAHPVGERPVIGYADTHSGAVGKVTGLLDAGWGS